MNILQLLFFHCANTLIHQKPMQLIDCCKIISRNAYLENFSAECLANCIVEQLTKKYFPIRLYKNNKTHYTDGFCLELLIICKNEIWISFIPLKKNVFVNESLTFRLMLFVFVCIADKDRLINKENPCISQHYLMETIYYQFKNNLRVEPDSIPFYKKFFRFNRISDEDTSKNKIKKLIKLHINNIHNPPLRKFGLQRIYLDSEFFLATHQLYR